MDKDDTAAHTGLDPARLQAVGDCLVWTGPRTSGYGRVYNQGRHQTVHRLAWERQVGPIPADKPLVLHRCRERACLDVRHLYLGDVKDRGRSASRKRSKRR